MPVEYKLMTCLPKTFPVFLPFSFSSRCLYSANVLLIISSLALSTLSCVHLCPNYPLSLILFNSSCFLCCSVPSFGASTTSPKNSSSVNLSPTLVIIFITYRNRHQMKNNVRYKGNINNTSVIIFLKNQKLPAMLICLGEPPVRFLCCCCCSFHFMIFILLLYFHVLILFILLLFSIHIFFSTSFLTPLWTIFGFSCPFDTFNPIHRRVICDTFIFNHSVIFLPQALLV